MSHLFEDFSLKDCKVTLTIISLVSLTYGLELLFAQSLAPQAAYTFLASYLTNHQLLAWFISPALHSSHSHIFWNLILFTPFACGFESRGRSDVFLFYSLLIAYIGVVGTQIVRGSLGVGISGLAYSLHSRELIYRAQRITQKPAIIHLVILLIASLLVSIGVAQAMRYIPSPSGTAHTAHFVGLLVGAVWQALYLDNFVLE
mgnify:CR=1 FL=1